MAPEVISREGRVVEAFVSLAGSLAAGDDVMDLLTMLTTTCADLLDVKAAGLLLADRRGVLHVMAASSDDAADLEAFQVQRAEGPCQDCYRGGVPVSVPDLADTDARWPQFVPAARRAGFVSVHALPMRLRTDVLGAMGLFGSVTGDLNPDDLRLGQALADVASLAIVQDRASTDRDGVTRQLQSALDSRVVLEQAKGMLAFSADLEVGESFTVLRQFARDHNLRLSDAAAAVVSRTLPVTQVLSHANERGTRGR